MSEGGMPTEVPTPERGQQNTTEASKGLLGKVANEAKRIVGEIKDSSQDPFGFNFPASPEAKKPSTPTKASKSFLERTGQRIKESWSLPALVPIVAAWATNTFMGSTVLEDIAQGDYRRMAVKGIIAGVSLVPLAVRTIRATK